MISPVYRIKLCGGTPGWAPLSARGGVWCKVTSAWDVVQSYIGAGGKADTFHIKVCRKTSNLSGIMSQAVKSDVTFGKNG